jgi:mannose-1-phosphate guanylyltransferase
LESCRFEKAHWVIILAGGDGKRLLPFTRRITGDERPKQFCAITGGETLLAQTRRRVARMVQEDQTLLVMTRTYEPIYSDRVAAVSPRRLVIQPFNHGTAPAITWSLVRFAANGPGRSGGFFPIRSSFW